MTVTSPKNLTTAELAQKTRRAAQQLAALSNGERNRALAGIAQALEEARADIEAANRADREIAKIEQIPAALYARLKLDGSKLTGAIAGLRDVARLADPIGQVQIQRRLDQGLVLRRLACPVGVLGVIFEARPDAVIQIAALAIKSGNGAILKGGREAVRSCKAIVQAIQAGLISSGIDPAAIQLLTSRAEIAELLRLERDVDLIIPRGSNAFVRYVQDNTRIPVLGHADGICHLYVDASADLDKAAGIALDSKCQYPAACNAIETLLVHRDLLPQGLAAVLTPLHRAQVALRGDAATIAALGDQFPIAPAQPEDWSTEYGELILAIRIVDDLEAAIAHINDYGSHHTDCIVTETAAAAEQFLAQVNSAGVYHNCSTRFADGFRYGFGAEVGISTQKLPPRGPVGLEGLVTYKYQLVGDGHVAASYGGEAAKPFLHEDF
ncbi:MAG: glutamate-5-semialdehyde dehydrogenase [Synechococcales cyanobacterium RM1_1_8]|nr:glutamate-5-semialdehyde dehydrogenase [Synechococcales cyanobacterium RM1_1_8]